MTLEFQLVVVEHDEYQSFVNCWRMFGKNYDLKAALGWAYQWWAAGEVGMMDHTQIGLILLIHTREGETATDWIGYFCLHKIKIVVIMSLMVNTII